MTKLVEELKVSNIELTGRRPRAEMPEFFKGSDVLIILLKPEFDLTIPAKFQAYIASGRAISGAVKGASAELIGKYDIGLVAAPQCRALQKISPVLPAATMWHLIFFHWTVY